MQKATRKKQRLPFHPAKPFTRGLVILKQEWILPPVLHQRGFPIATFTTVWPREKKSAPHIQADVLY